METTTGFISTPGATSDCGTTIRVKEARRKVALVCMVDSIHTARWIEMFANENIDFYLLPSTPNRRVHPKIREMIHGKSDQISKVKIFPFGGAFSIILYLLDLVLNNSFRGLILSRLVTRHKIQYVHALELNHGGYVMSRSRKFGTSCSAKYIATNWGSDIYWFQQFPRHQRKIEKLMLNSDFYSAECNRDLELATKYGFQGQFMEVFPNAGGFPERILSQVLTPPSNRNLILIKGYESFVGRASVALSAIEQIVDELNEFELIVYSANYKTRRIVKDLQKFDIKIKCFPKKYLSHDEMLSLFQKARIYVGVSLSDGISTSLLEAMASGAFPIQTNSSCANEWIEDGSTGFIVNVKKEEIVEALRFALREHQRVDEAAHKNQLVVKERLKEENIKIKALKFYNS